MESNQNLDHWIDGPLLTSDAYLMDLPCCPLALISSHTFFNLFVEKNGKVVIMLTICFFCSKINSKSSTSLISEMSLSLSLKAPLISFMWQVLEHHAPKRQFTINLGRPFN